MPLTLARQAGSKDAAFLVIMDKARDVILLPLAGFVWIEKGGRRRQFSRRATLGERFQTGDANRRAARRASSDAWRLLRLGPCLWNCGPWPGSRCRRERVTR